MLKTCRCPECVKMLARLLGRRGGSRVWQRGVGYEFSADFLARPQALACLSSGCVWHPRALKAFASIASTYLFTSPIFHLSPSSSASHCHPSSSATPDCIWCLLHFASHVLVRFPPHVAFDIARKARDLVVHVLSAQAARPTAHISINATFCITMLHHM